MIIFTDLIKIKIVVRLSLIKKSRIYSYIVPLRFVIIIVEQRDFENIEF